MNNDVHADEQSYDYDHEYNVVLDVLQKHYDVLKDINVFEISGVYSRDVTHRPEMSISVCIEKYPIS